MYILLEGGGDFFKILGNFCFRGTFRDHSISFTLNDVHIKLVHFKRTALYMIGEAFQRRVGKFFKILAEYTPLFQFLKFNLNPKLWTKKNLTSTLMSLELPNIL